MRVSFDLDDTLISYQKAVPCEPAKLPLLKFWLKEPLRQGSRALIADLKRSGCDVWARRVVEEVKRRMPSVKSG